MSKPVTVPVGLYSIETGVDTKTEKLWKLFE